MYEVLQRIISHRKKIPDTVQRTKMNTRDFILYVVLIS